MSDMAGRMLLEGRPTKLERLYDGLSLLLLMWPATGGMWLMGSTRTWGYAPGLFLSFLGSMLVLGRPLVFAETPRWPIPPGLTWFGLMAAYSAIGVFVVSVPEAARWEALRWGCLVAAGFSWVQLGGRGHRWKWLLGVLFMAVALDGLYAVIQHVNGSREVLWTMRPDQYGLRVSGTYLCPNHFANMVAMLVPMAMVMMALPEAGVPLRILSVYFLAIAAPVLYWSQSRSGWLGTMGGIGITLLLLAWRAGRRWLLIALVALPLLAGVVSWGAWMTLSGVRERIGVVLEDPEKAGGVRIKMWLDAPAMIQDRPVWGFGGGSYVWAYPPYQQRVDEHRHWDYPHNEYLQTLLEYGAVGLGLVLLGLLSVGWGVARAVKTARSNEGAFLMAGAGGALTASLLHALFDFNFHIFPNPHALVWVGGVSWGLWAALERGRMAETGRRRNGRRIVSGICVALCGAGAWLALAGGMSYVWNLKGDLAREHMDWDPVERDYQKAIAWDDRNWRPHVGLGHFKVSQATWYRDPDLAAEKAEKQRLAEEAVSFYQAGLERNPLDMEAEFGQARALLLLGAKDEALAHLTRAASYQRRHVFYREQLGIQLRRMGRESEALAAFRRNVEDGVYTDVSVLNIRSLERKAAREAAAEKPLP